jgi:hypothetical protein
MKRLTVALACALSLGIVVLPAGIEGSGQPVAGIQGSGKIVVADSLVADWGGEVLE